MTVQELIEKLSLCNRSAVVRVIAHCKPYEFTIAFGGEAEGTEDINCETLDFYVDELCTNETQDVKKELYFLMNSHGMYIQHIDGADKFWGYDYQKAIFFTYTEGIKLFNEYHTKNINVSILPKL